MRAVLATVVVVVVAVVVVILVVTIVAVTVVVLVKVVEVIALIVKIVVVNGSSNDPGHHPGVGYAPHAMRLIVSVEEREAMFTAVATNAFTTINRQTWLHNIRTKYSTFAPYIDNT